VDHRFPKYPQSVRREYWRLIKQGVMPVNAAVEIGLSEGCGSQWYREAGGVSPVDLSEPSRRYLNLAEREEIAVLHGQRLSRRAIAARLGRSASTVSREIVRNSPTGHGPRAYRGVLAQLKTDKRARRPKVSKLAGDERLRNYVQAKLGGIEHWSPEQISRRLVVDFPDDERMRISDEAIYLALYVQGRGGLRRELTKCLRTGRSVRKPVRRVDGRGQRGWIAPELLISNRPVQVEDRAVPGNWEGDLIVGKLNGSAIGTLVERTTRFVMLLHLPQGQNAFAVRDAITSTIGTLPAQMRRSLTWDQGKEMSQHVQLRLAADLPIYFCDPHSPWQRGTNENTNGLLRQYFPKGENLADYSAEDIAAVAAALNGRPRKTLAWKTPAEAMAELLSRPA
jgi:IS30 family transposase